MNPKNVDDYLYTLPGIGSIIKRYYAYFKQHTAFANVVHIVFGLGLGFIIAGKDLFLLGVFALLLGILGHVWAFVKGG